MTKDELMALIDRYATCKLGEPLWEARAALSDALDAVVRDAERYRWLQPALISGGSLDEDHAITKAFCHIETTPTSAEFDAAIDAAIDAAMKATK